MNKFLAITIVSLLFTGCATQAQRQWSELTAGVDESRESRLKCLYAAMEMPTVALVAIAIPLIDDATDEQKTLPYKITDGSETDWANFREYSSASLTCEEAYTTRIKAVHYTFGPAASVRLTVAQGAHRAFANGEITMGQLNDVLHYNDNKYNIELEGAVQKLSGEFAASHQAEIARRSQSFQTGLAIMQRSGAATGVPSAYSAASTTAPNVSLQCTKSGEQRSGLGKICYYNCLGTTRALNLSATDLCPIWQTF